jgi:hypothetical protein
MHKELEYNKKEMPKRRPPIKPFVYGKYLIEYREGEGGLLRFIRNTLIIIKMQKLFAKSSQERVTMNQLLKKLDD